MLVYNREASITKLISLKVIALDSFRALTNPVS
jgi:hypothetical protein